MLMLAYGNILALILSRVLNYSCPAQLNTNVPPWTGQFTKASRSYHSLENKAKAGEIKQDVWGCLQNLYNTF